MGGERLYKWGGIYVVCAVEVLESTQFCASPVISGVIRDVPVLLPGWCVEW